MWLLHFTIDSFDLIHAVGFENKVQLIVPAPTIYVAFLVPKINLV